MASLETRGGRFRIVFRLEGQKFSKTLDTKNPKAANVTLAKLEHRLGQYEIGGLIIPTGCDPVEFLLNGSLRQKSAPVKKTYGNSVTVKQSWNIFKEVLPDGALEESTLKGMNTHIEHLARLIGKTVKLKDIDKPCLQRYIDKRSKEPGRYASVIRDFVLHMKDCGLDPLTANGDDIRIFREALRQAGMQPATIAKQLSIIRGVYRQFGKRGLVDWETVQDIQAVESPSVQKNSTPILTEAEAKKLLHQPDLNTLAGVRDHALLFVFFKTACRVSALASATIGSLERSDHEFYLVVEEKGGKRQRKALLESSLALIRYLEFGRIIDQPSSSPLFRPVAKDRNSVARMLTNASRRSGWGQCDDSRAQSAN